MVCKEPTVRGKDQGRLPTERLPDRPSTNNPSGQGKAPRQLSDSDCPSPGLADSTPLSKTIYRKFELFLSANNLAINLIIIHIIIIIVVILF